MDIEDGYPELGLNDKIRFGKWKGASIRAVISEDVKYIEWALANVAGFRIDEEAKAMYWEYLDIHDTSAMYEQHDYYEDLGLGPEDVF
jgi:hypothetical protein